MRVRFVVLAALAAALILVPGAGARQVGEPHARQGDCGPGSGTLPTVASVTVDGVAVPGGSQSAGPGMGKLYYSTEAGNGQQNGSDCLYPFTVKLNRDYTGAGPTSGWMSVVGTGPWFLDHAAFAQKFNPAYADSPAVSEASTVVVTLTLPADGSYAAQNAYWYVTNGKLDGNNAIVLNGNTLTITGRPAQNVVTAQQWPTGLPADYNALAVDAATYYNQFGGTNNWPGGEPNGYGDSGPFGAGGAIAQVSSMGLQFSVTARFAGTLGMGSEQQRGSWFEAVNTPRWSTMYSNNGGTPSLTLGMGNYHEYYATAANTVTLNTGSLRMMLPDAWALLGFGVSSASDPTLIQGAIQVTRTEAGATTPVVATTTPVPGVGIVVDVGAVSFSSPNYTTRKNTAVRARVSGTNVVLQFSLTAAQLKAGKNKVTVYGGTKKLKKLVTVAAKKGRNTVTVALIKKGGYAVKAGKTVVGSATLGSSGGGNGGGSGGMNNGGGNNKGDCPKQNCTNR